MSEMVERVAKAIEDHCWIHEAHQPVDPMGIARAAIASLSEPAKEMIKMGAAVFNSWEDSDNPYLEECCALVFKAMIEKALEDESSS